MSTSIRVPATSNSPGTASLLGWRCSFKRLGRRSVWRSARRPGLLELVVRGGTIVTAEGSFPGEIGIQESLIAAVGSPGMLPPGSRELDATGLLVLPGLVDPHVHLGHRVFIEGRWVHASDDFWSGTRFAAAGGNTTVIDFAIQREGDLAATFRARRAEADGKSVVDYSLHVALTKASAETIDSIPDLIASGV